MGRHVKRASRQKIAWFRKRPGPLIEGKMRAGYTACVQDEAICIESTYVFASCLEKQGMFSKHTKFVPKSENFLKPREQIQKF